MTTRRTILLSALAAACAPATPEILQHPPNSVAFTVAERSLAEIEARIGGRVGVWAYDLGTEQRFGHRADERFAMCSTFKWLLAAQYLQWSERTPAILEQRVQFDESDLLEYAPATRAHLADGAMTVEELCAAAVTLSDNTAANLLLNGVMGPQGLTNWLRANADSVTRLDRNEPLLNVLESPTDERDTTTPRAMAETAARILATDTVLNAASRERLIGWMIESTTGRERLRAGLPAGWRAGDKTGTGPAGATNDVAIFWPPERPPTVIACYLYGSAASLADRNAAHAEVARLAVQAFGLA